MSQDSQRSDLLSTPVSRRAFARRATVAAGAIAIVGVGGSQLVMASQDTATPPASPSPSSSPAASPAAGTEFEVHAEDIKYSPKELTIPADTEVKIKVVNKGALQHDLHIDKLDITSKMLNGGDEDTITVKAAAGEYDFWCTVPGHKEAGMVGKLTVK